MDYSGESGGLLVNSHKGSNRTFYIIVALLAIWNILLFSLAVSGVALARKNANDDDDSSSTDTSCILSTMAMYDEAEQVILGGAVSLSTAGGSVRLGGGTSIYKMQSIAETTPSLSDFVLVDVDETHAFLAFLDPQGFLYTSIGTQEGAEIEWTTPANSAHQASHLSSGIRVNTNLVLLATDVGIFTVTPLPVPVIMTPQANTVSSANTQMCTLDTNVFALSYPDSNNQLSTRVGTVTGTTIQWSNNTAEYADYSSAHSVACFAPFYYVLSFIDGTSITNQAVYYNDVSGTVNLTVSATLADVTARSFIKNVPLKRSLAIGGVLYIDESKDNALVVRSYSLTLDQVQFGASLFINSGGELNSTSSKIADISPFGLESGFIVTYSDWSNQEKITLMIGEVTESNSLLFASPSYVLSPANEDVIGEEYWSSVVALSDTDFVNVFALMDESLAIPQSVSSSVGHVFNAPIGIIMDISQLDGAPAVVVAVSGQCKADNAIMQSGYYYYTDGLGNLFMPDPSQTTLDDYLDLGTMLLSKDSLVGIGISSEDLLIKSSPF